tara:strand:- start:635 stop:940 length:306 start_codon:yes stop_codon:yes gene_type:complete
MKAEEIVEKLINNEKFMENMRNSMEYRLGNYSHMHDYIKRMVTSSLENNKFETLDKHFTGMITTVILEDKNKNLLRLIKGIIIKELPSILDMYFKLLEEDE